MKQNERTTKQQEEETMNWLVPYDRLDNEQRGILQSFQARPKNNLWITGYAGSGKSVLLIHILITIKEKFPSASVCVVGFTHALIDQLKSGIPFEYRPGVSVLTPQDFAKRSVNWDYILVDEVQDLKHDFFVDLSRRGSTVIAAGDMNQSIYEDTCPEYDIIDYLDLDIRRLNIIHRLSRNARTLAAPFCTDKSGFMSASMSSAVNLQPSLVSARNYDEELEWLAGASTAYAGRGYHTAILFPNHNEVRYFLRNLCDHYGVGNSFVRDMEYGEWSRNYYSEINMGLNNAGLDFRYLGNGAGNLREYYNGRKVLIMTMHSVKGLDFDVTFVPFLTRERAIFSGNTPAENLFFVALTRAREQMFLSYNSSNPHKYLGLIDSSCLRRANAADEITHSHSSAEMF